MMHWLLFSVVVASSDSYLLLPEQQQEQLTQHAMFPGEGNIASTASLIAT